MSLPWKCFILAVDVFLSSFMVRAMKGGKVEKKGETHRKQKLLSHRGEFTFKERKICPKVSFLVFQMRSYKTVSEALF